MFKRLICLITVTLLLTIQSFFSNESAIALNRTVPLNDSGDTTVLSITDIIQGRKLFAGECSQCHSTGFNDELSLESLALATPARDNIKTFIEFLKNPMSYDGERDISEFHPSIKSADLYPEMKNMTENDLYDLSAYILSQ